MEKKFLVMLAIISIGEFWFIKCELLYVHTYCTYGQFRGTICGMTPLKSFKVVCPSARDRVQALEASFGPGED